MGNIERVTVFLDTSKKDLVECVRKAAGRLDSGATVVLLSEANLTDVPSFIQFLQGAQEDDGLSCHEDSTEPLQRFSCFVTEERTKRDGIVAYAMYCAHIPVLSLVEDSSTEVGEYWITAALFTCLESRHNNDREAAIAEFFNFPEVAGRLIAVEGENSSLVLSYCLEIRRKINGACDRPVLLLGPNGCELSEQGAEVCATGDAAEQMEMEAGLYASLISGLFTCENGELYHRDPQLHGALYALNRHHNFPVIRYRLQRGVNLILCRPMSTYLGKLYDTLKQQEETAGGDVRRSFTNTLESLIRFEQKWLDVPERDVLLLRTCDCKGWSSYLGHDAGGMSLPVNWDTVDVGPGGNSVDSTGLVAVLGKVQKLFCFF